MNQPLVDPSADGASAAEAFYNMLCFTVGAGMLGLPRALLFAQHLYFLPVLLGGLLCLYTAQLLHRAQLDRGADSYQALAVACGGRGAGLLVGVVLAANQVGIAVLYVIQCCKNFELLHGGDVTAPAWYWYPAIGGIIISASAQGGGGMTGISSISLVGLVSALAVGMLVVASAEHEKGAEAACSTANMPEVLAGLGTAIFAYGGHPVFPDAQGNMANPKQFTFVIYLAFALMMVLFLLVTKSTWDSCGCSVHGYVLEDLPDSWWRTAAVGGITLHLLAALPVTLAPVVRVLRLWVRPSSAQSCCVLLVFAVVGAAYVFPFFSDFLALVGAFTENALVLIFPLALHMLTFRHWCTSAMGIASTAFNAAILPLALAILTVGTSAALGNILKMWNEYHVRLLPGS